MVDFSVLQLNSEQPIYCQLVEYVELLVVTGQAVSGQELPSRRLVSAQLGVNPNTVQKAYRQLEQQGLLESSAGAKSVLCFTEEQRVLLQICVQQDSARRFIGEMQRLGLDKQQAFSLISSLWKREEEES